jgi:hypothetical protein
MDIYLLHDGNQLGPYCPEEIRARISRGALDSTSLGWAEGFADWRPVSEILQQSAEVIHSGAESVPAEDNENLGWPAIVGGLILAALVVGIVVAPIGMWSEQQELSGKWNPPDWLATVIALAIVASIISLGQIFARRLNPFCQKKH